MAKGTIHVLDDYYLGITALITIGYQLSFFAVAFYFKFDKLTGTLQHHRLHKHPHRPRRPLIHTHTNTPW